MDHRRQLSTSHASVWPSAVESAFSAIARVQTSVELDILIVGAREVPELFAALTDPRKKPAREIYLWYNLLSDIPGMETSDLVVDWRGGRSRGWGGWSEQNPDVQETFRFACPNNPNVVRKTLAAMTAILDRYPFDGVFLDKMRFPSPANGADELLSCFCNHCREAAEWKAWTWRQSFASSTAEILSANFRAMQTVTTSVLGRGTSG